MNTRYAKECAIALALLATGCGESSISAPPSAGNQTSPVRLSFHVSLRGIDMADAIITLLTGDGAEIAGFEAQTDGAGYVDGTEINNIPDDGFIARACLPKPGTQEVQCLYAVWDAPPEVAALVSLNEVTTRAYDPGFVPCDWVTAAAQPRAGVCALPPIDPLLVDPWLARDPLANGPVGSSGWVDGAIQGISEALTPKVLMTAVINQLMGMGLRFLEGTIFPPDDTTRQVIDKLDHLNEMVAAIQTQIHAEFDSLTHEIDDAVVAGHLPLIKAAIMTLRDADNALLGKLGAKLTRADLLRASRATSCPAIPFAIMPRSRRRATRSSPTTTLLQYYGYRDAWNIGHAATGLYSANYSTGLYKLYTAMVGALAQAQDIDTRIYHYNMTMLDAAGEICSARRARARRASEFQKPASPPLGSRAISRVSALRRLCRI